MKRTLVCSRRADNETSVHEVLLWSPGHHTTTTTTTSYYYYCCCCCYIQFLFNPPTSHSPAHL